jgi:hypothetical protein
MLERRRIRKPGKEISKRERGDQLIKVPELLPTLTRERRKIEKGCAIRALESSLGVSAKEAEWQMRLDQLTLEGDNSIKIGSLLKQLVKSGFNRRSTSIEYADRLLERLITQFARHDSPLGEALRERPMQSYGRLDERNIRELLRSGRSVCINVKLEGKVSRHTVHVAEDIQGRLIAQSDGGLLIDLSSGAYRTIAFGRPEQPPARLTVNDDQRIKLNEVMKYL